MYRALGCRAATDLRISNHSVAHVGPAGLGVPAKTTFGFVEVESVQQLRGLTPKALSGVTHGIHSLVNADQMQVQLVLALRNARGSTSPVDPQQFLLRLGRRGGKSFILAVIAVFLACFKDWRPYLGPGEVATIMIIARDRRQARVIKRFITGLLHATPMLRRTIEKETADGIRLRNRVAMEIHTASFSSTRGYTIVAALLDEIAFWPTDEGSAEPDIEVINAIKPGMATIPKAMLLCASSPHARRGALWNAYRKHFGKDGDPVLVWQAATRDMNPSVPRRFIDKDLADDFARAQAEYLAQFRTDVERFIPPEIVEACVGDFPERSPMPGFVYFGFVDPSGGSDAAMTLAIGHKTRAPEEQIVIDVVPRGTSAV